MKYRRRIYYSSAQRARQSASSHDRAMKPMGVLAVSTDLELERGAETPGILMNLPRLTRWVTMGSGGQPLFL